MTKRQTKPSVGREYFTLPWAMFLTLLIFSACQSSTKEAGSTAGFDPDKDYFPDKVEVKHSLGFGVEYESHYKKLHIFRHYNDLVDTVSYVLLQRGTPTPETDLPIIEVPVQKVVSMSTTHLGMFAMLDGMETLKGIEIAQYVTNPEVKQAVANGKIVEVAPAGALNVESVIGLNTDVLLGVGYPNSQNEAYQQLERTGVPVLLNADWQETDLLGRAEWVKLLAVLLNKEALVNEKFGAIETEYHRVLNMVKNSRTEAPLTITGIALGDAWHVAGGRSFAYKLLQIVKADYPWKNDQSTGSIKLDFETVYEFGLKADFWIAPGSAKSEEDILSRDTRYADFKAFKKQQIYNIFGRYTEGGGNDYYETGVVEPQVILKDIVKIFHPELLPDHELVYHSQLK
ncbi:MAG: ABC transporter substrate-binding protein [Roseivirga sp.]|nr:ABC transporter substrate-binding protein [Roseivirga sp.]